MKPAVAYYRVSTERQRRSGLGIDAQKAAVARFQRDLGWRGRGNTGPKTWARLF